MEKTVASSENQFVIEFTIFLIWFRIFPDQKDWLEISNRLKMKTFNLSVKSFFILESYDSEKCYFIKIEISEKKIGDTAEIPNSNNNFILQISDLGFLEVLYLPVAY